LSELGARGPSPAGTVLCLLVLVAAGLLLPPVYTVQALSVDHTVGNVDAAVSDHGRLYSLQWNGVEQLCLCPLQVDNELGLAIDQANYDHTQNDGGGGPNDDDGFFLSDAFETDFSVSTPIYFEENTPTKQRSTTVFNHTGADPDDRFAPFKEVGDLAIAQTAWTESAGDWIVLRWELQNTKATSLTDLRFTVYGSYSGALQVLFDPYGGVGGSAGNDVESWDAGKATYYVRDLNGAPTATTLAIASALAADPMDRYVTHPIEFTARDQASDDTLYGMVKTEPNGLGSGITNGISALLGWANGGMTVPAGGTRVFVAVFAFGMTVPAADAAVAAARAFYLRETTGMKITEIVDSPAPQLEVWNDAMGPVDLSTWSVGSESGALSGTWNPMWALNGGHSVFTVTGGTLDPEADTITLRDDTALIRDVAAYGWRGPVPDAVSGESAQRAWDSLGQRYSSEWSRAATPNLGVQNGALRHDAAPSVVLNEVAFTPGALDAFIELYYRGSTSQDISGYTIVVDRVYTVPPGTVLTTTKRWFVLRQPGFPAFYGLTASADNVYLYNPAGRFLDKVGWAMPHPADRSVARAAEGVGTAIGFEESTDLQAGWVFDDPMTMNLIGVQEPQTAGGDPGDLIEFWLNVTNFKADVDRIELAAVPQPNGWPVQLQTTARTPLPDTGGAAGADSGPLGLDQTLTFLVSVPIPAQGLVGDEEFILVTAQSGTDGQVSARLVLDAEVFPHPEVTKTSSWPTLFAMGTGFTPDYTPVQLIVDGRGVPQVDQRPQDVVFLVDNSGSMTQPPYMSDPTHERWDAVGCYVNQMSNPDRGAIVAFGDPTQSGTLYVAWYVRSPLTPNYPLLYSDTQDPANRFGSGGTPIRDAIQLGNDELIARGTPSSTWVEILLTDGVPSPPLQGDVAGELARAVANNIRIFTIGLGVFVDEPFLRNIADTTGGQYFFADSPDDLCQIYLSIGQLVMDVAAQPLPGGTTAMVVDRVPYPFSVVPGTVYPPPAAQWYDPVNGDEVIEWDPGAIRVGERWGAGYDVTCADLGTWNATHWPLASINYESWDGETARMLIPSLPLTCMPGIDIQPPRDLRTEVLGNHVLVTWQPPADPLGVDGYHVFASPTPTDFDFGAPPAAIVLGQGTLAWMDPSMAVTLGERYYVARSFNGTLGTTSVTSNTGGKFTVDLGSGPQAVAQPLEPYAALDAATLGAQLGAASIRTLVGGVWVDAAGIPVASGSGYLVDRLAPGLFTYVGRPAAMVQYRDGWGFGYLNPESLSLTATVSGNDVSLSWTGALGPSLFQFLLYRSTTRMGFFDGTAAALYPGVATTYTDANVLAGSPEVYYMVVPQDTSSGFGGGLYSVGVIRRDLAGTSVLGLPLAPFASGPVSWYADQIPGALGLLWFDPATGAWVPHFTAMAAGVYDASVSRAVAYQVATQGASTFTFVGG